jgi:branched-chain amino acid transport system ATP-binding protein
VSTKAGLVAEQLCVRYRTGALGITDVSLELRPGQLVALLGPNGAGKTTTVRAISGFLKNEGTRLIGGRVTLAGRDMTRREPYDFARAGVAVVPERQKILPHMTVHENLLAIGHLPRRAERARRMARVCALFPELEPRFGEQSTRLSGGQQQMLAIGRALMVMPSVLIIDEMTLGLHVSLIPLLHRIVREIADDGTAVLIVDENAAAAVESADYCYVLHAGKVSRHGVARDFADTDLLELSYVGE